MVTAYEETLQLTSQLTLAEKILLLQHLTAALRQDIETEAYRHMPWEQFIDLTYGSLADDPIERNQPPHPDERDEIE